ncbi:Synaptotagmin-like protein 2 [Merluccius polli]|uniref:Synaptotagmin-like protein 2 n=1 Tax=Merluccius polli TaxID=89951 RepID=A0AA47M458_MERPO|nr:Synaptotagmin-like protein 2 [Merluccius polli]
MIDLSHLTDEEQERIMMVLNRDTELKKHEEERVSNLQKLLDRGKRSETKLKYLTGEWFYEAKSRRHKDRIHGSEIILASMKQRKTSNVGMFDLIYGRGISEIQFIQSKSFSQHSPPTQTCQTLRFTPSPGEERLKYALLLTPFTAVHCILCRYSCPLLQTGDAPTAFYCRLLDAENDQPKSALRSPGRQRHNPFNRASLIVVEPNEKTEEPMITEDRGHHKSSDTEAMAPLKDPIARPPTSGGSISSQGSSTGFRPVPKKRTFASRRSSTSANNVPGRDLPEDAKVIVPAPRLSLQQRSQCVAASQSSERSVESHAQETEASVCQFSPRVVAAQPLQHPTAVLQKEEPAEVVMNVPSVTPEITIAYTDLNWPTDIGRVSPEKSSDLKRNEYGDSLTTYLSTNKLKEQERGKNSKDGSFSDSTAFRDEELSMTQSFVDQPVRYDLNLIYQHTAPTSSPKPKLSHQIFTASEGEEGSIAKVLEWFSRSTDSNDWLDTEDSQQSVVNMDRKEDIKVKGTHEDRKRDNTGYQVIEMKRDHLVKESNEVKETIERKKEVRVTREDVKKDARQEAKVLSIKEKEDDNQADKISNLKSFWEKGNTGPKILISRSNPAISDKRQKPVIFQLDKDRQEETNDHIFDMASAPERGKYNTSTSKDEKKQIPTSYRQGDMDFIISSVHNIETGDIKPKQADYTKKKVTSLGPEPEIYSSLTYHRNESSPRTTRKEGPSYATDHLMLQTDPQVFDRRGSDTEIISLTTVSTQPKTQSRSIIGSAMQPALEASQSRASPVPDKPSSSLLSSSLTTPQQDEFQMDHDTLHQSIPSPFMDDQRSGSNVLSTSKPPMQRHTNEDTKRKVNEDGAVQIGMAPKKDLTNKDIMQNNPNSTRLPPQRQETTAERIRQLKSFWEQEKDRPVFYTGKSKDGGEGKIISAPNSGKLNKRFTKSEYDLRSIDKDTDDDLDDSNGNRQNFTQRQETSCPSAQFNNLREFWGDSHFSRRGSFIAEKTKPPKNKEIIDSQSPGSDLQQSVETDFHNKPPPAIIVEKSSFRPALVSKSSPPAQSGQHKDSRRGSKETPREEKTSTKLQSNAGKETRSPKARKDSFGNISSRTSAMRRATSMFSLNVSEEQNHGKKSQEGVRRQSVDKSQHRRQSEGRVSISRRPSVDSESQALRARAFVPRDYRHYLGMTEKTSVHNSLAPVVSEQVSEGKSGYDLEPSGPVRASTPVGSEERYGRRGSKTSQRPLWVNHSSSDTGRESSVSSTSETRSNSRTSSNWENDSEDPNPVKRALRRAEGRPKNMTKSLEDITASVSPRQERRPEIIDMRRSSDATSISTASTSSFSDPDHMKKMSKSVPAFLQKELSGSVMTMYSGDFGNVEVQGNIQFSINYVQKLREFHIFVAQCQGLAAVDPKRGRSDPYVKSYLVPDKANLGKRKTSVKKKTLNPTFNEILRYRVRMEYLRTQTLILSMWHHDTFGKNSFLGEVDVDLSTWDFDHTQMNYLALRARMPSSLTPSDDRGEIRLAIRFLPQVTPSEGVTKDGPPTGEVHIWVKECKNLPLIRATIDPYLCAAGHEPEKSSEDTRIAKNDKSHL